MTRQLTLVEAGRLLRSPYLWVAVVAALALLTWGSRDKMVNLAEVTIDAAVATVLVAIVVMVLANLATLRDQRNRMPELLAALPGTAAHRTRAVLVAAAGVAAALAGLVVGGFLLVTLARAALSEQPVAGLVDAREALGAMAAAALLAVLGVALGRWLPSLVAVPAVLVGLGMFALSGVLFILIWNAPATAPYFAQAYGRPAGLRLVYLAALLVLLAAVALLRHGWRPARLGVAATGLAVALAAGIALPVTAPPRLGGLERAHEFGRADPEPTCVERSGVTYCHLPGFAEWVPLWDEVVAPIAAALPPDWRDRLPTVVQHSEQHAAFRQGPALGEVAVGTSWHQPAAGGWERARLAGQVAVEVTGLAAASQANADAADLRDPSPYPRLRGCNAVDQARTAVALWLAGQAAPLRWDAKLPAVWYDEPEIAYGEAMLADDDIQELVWQHWDTLLDPSTSLDDLGSLLGLSTAPYPPSSSGGTACG